MSQLSELINLLLSVEGLLLAIGVFVALLVSQRNQLVRWMLLGGLILAASLNRFRNEWIQVPPSFFGPIDVLVGNGRSVTILLAIALLLVSVRRSKDDLKIPVSYLALVVAHYVIAIKIFTQGSLAFALLLVATETLLLVVFVRIGKNWIKDRESVDYALFAVLFAVFGFVLINLIQWYIDPTPLFVAQNRFNGTTGNPLHAATFLATATPICLYFMLTRRGWVRVATAALLAVVAILLLATGSRLGVLLSAISIVVLLRKNVGALVVVGFTCGLAVLWMIFLGDASELERITRTEDTRTAVWAAMLGGFIENPLFGIEMRSDRLGFGENSWLAMGSNAGVIGLLPLVVFGLLSVHTIRKLMNMKTATSSGYLQNGAVASTIAMLLVGSLFEAYLLSGLMAPINILVLCLLLAARLIHLEKRKRILSRKKTVAHRLVRLG